MATILTIEDDPDITEMLRLVLQLEGYAMQTAAHGYAGLVQLQQPVDLILCDVQTPGLDGVEVYQRLRADPGYGTLPFIFMSALSPRLAVTDRHLAFLRKLLDPATLLTTIALMINDTGSGNATQVG